MAFGGRRHQDVTPRRTRSLASRGRSSSRPSRETLVDRQILARLVAEVAQTTAKGRDVRSVVLSGRKPEKPELRNPTCRRGRDERFGLTAGQHPLLARPMAAVAAPPRRRRRVRVIGSQGWSASDSLRPTGRTDFHLATYSGHQLLSSMALEGLAIGGQYTHDSSRSSNASFALEAASRAANAQEPAPGYLRGVPQTYSTSPRARRRWC